MKQSAAAEHILATVEASRLLKATEGLVSGAYRLTLASQSDEEIRGFVANGDGKEYGIVLSNGQAFCSCRDAMYRHTICKHAVALALFALRHPRREQSDAPQTTEPTRGEATPHDLRLTKVRKGFAFSA